MKPQPTILHIALATPLRQVFDYLPHEQAEDKHWQAGQRVSVPFGKQNKIGIILGVSQQSDHPIHKLKRIHHHIDDKPIMPIALLELMQWASDYYHHPLGDTLFTALPTYLREGKYPYPETLPKKNPFTQPPAFQSALTLNSEQQAAVRCVSQQHEFTVTLLEGITGSGKTLVYMHVINDIIKQNKQALILVPEIGLTPQTIQRFERAFQCKIAAIHSALTPKKRADAWLAARTGQARIVIGTRSAIFTPMCDPGIIIIDEEHDTSFKQQEGFRYSARDLAVVRAQQENIPLLLGSATPSSETYYNVQRQRYQHCQLTQRAGDANPPKTKLLDIRGQSLHEGLSPTLLQTISEHLSQQGQVLLFVNRRGYAPTIVCHQCGWIASCHHCDARLTLHRANQQLRCHHCLRVYPLIHTCEKCTSPSLVPLGVGTQRLENLLQKHFSHYQTARIDRDTITRKGQLEQLLNDFSEGKTQILIGTQMLAKGHDFENLTLVAIIDIDSGLYSSDFRAVERMGQLITQVAGRAGRAHRAGEVVLQTRNPDNPLLQSLISQPYPVFLDSILQQRQQAALPPYQHFVMLRADANKPGIPMQFLQQVREHLQTQTPTVEVLGPIPALMERRADRFRAQLLLSASNRNQLKATLTPTVNWLRDYKHNLGRSLRWSVDVDPLEMF